MPNPFAPVLSLTEETRKQLESLIRAGSTPQAFVFRRFGWSYGPLTPIARPICKSRPNWIVIVTQSPSGGIASRGRVSRVYRTLRGPVGHGGFPPSAHVDVVSIATSEPSDYGCTATRWSLDDIAATILNQAHAEAMSRSTVFRILDDADLKPHRSVYWLNSHDPDFQAKAREVCGLYVSSSPP